MVLLVTEVSPGHRALWEPQVEQGHLVVLVETVDLDHKEQQGPLEDLDVMEDLEHPEQRETLEDLDPQVRQAPLDGLDSLVAREQQDYLEEMGDLGH